MEGFKSFQNQFPKASIVSLRCFFKYSKDVSHKDTSMKNTSGYIYKGYHVVAKLFVSNGVSTKCSVVEQVKGISAAVRQNPLTQ